MKLARGYISVQKDGVYYIQSESLQRFLLSEDDKTKLETIYSILSDSTKAIVPKKVWFEIESSIVIDKTYKYKEIKKENEMYKCPSYYDNDNILQDCECGECK